MISKIATLVMVASTAFAAMPISKGDFPLPHIPKNFKYIALIHTWDGTEYTFTGDLITSRWSSDLNLAIEVDKFYNSSTGTKIVTNVKVTDQGNNIVHRYNYESDP
jgi:hypothetical protein